MQNPIPLKGTRLLIARHSRRPPFLVIWTIVMLGILWALLAILVILGVLS